MSFGRNLVILQIVFALSCKLSTPENFVMPDPVAPANVTNFVARAISTNTIVLSWENPVDIHFANVKILRKTGGYPASSDDGVVIYEGRGTMTDQDVLTINAQYYFAAYAISWGGGANSSGVKMGAYPNNILPSVTASTPDNAATGIAPCSGDPCRAKIILQFSETMNTALTQTLTTEIWNGSAYLAAPISVLTATWSSTLNYSDTLTLTVSWLWFAENSQIRYTLPAANLQDTMNNAVSTQVQRSFTTTTAKQNFMISDAGLVTCYNDTALQACPFASHPGQDADFANVPNARSFTGPTALAEYSTDYITTDNVTGLVWRSCSDGLTDAACATGTINTYTWYNALNQCSVLNGANAGNGYAGRTTWRMPTQRELRTLPNFSGSNPAIDTPNFPATVSAEYWSLTTDLNSMDAAWYLSFNVGASLNFPKTSSFSVRCVSTDTLPTQFTFTDNGDGTVTDMNTSLRWQKCSRGQNDDATCTGAATTATWQTALQYCDTLTLGSFANASNWRLPNANELLSLVDQSVTNPSIVSSNFPATVSNSYWSSSTAISLLNRAWLVQFTTGNLTNGTKTGFNSARCVATGP
jgi:hypothetical protein